MKASKSQANQYNKVDSQYEYVDEEDNKAVTNRLKSPNNKDIQANKISFNKFKKNILSPKINTKIITEANLIQTAKFSHIKTEHLEEDIPLEDDKFSPDYYNNTNKYSLNQSVKSNPTHTTDNNTLNPHKIRKISSNKLVSQGEYNFIEEDEDEEDESNFELEGESKQIMDYQRSMSSKYKFNIQSRQNQVSNLTSLSNNLVNNTNVNKHKDSDIDMLNIELSNLKKDNLKLRKTIVSLENNKDKETNELLEDLQLKLSQKTKELKESNHRLNVTEEMYGDLEASIIEVKSKLIDSQKELKEKNDIIAELTNKPDYNQDNMKTLKNNIDKLQKDLEQSRDDLINKTNKINELQTKIISLEQEKFEISTKTGSENISLKEIKSLYEHCKLENIELKNTNDLLNLKLNTYTEENSSLKKEIFFLEKELGNKSSILEKIKYDGKKNYEDFNEDNYLKKATDNVSKRAETAKNKKDDHDYSKHRVTQSENTSNDNMNNLKKNMRSQVFSSEKDNKTFSSITKKRDPNETYSTKDSNLLAFNNKVKENKSSLLENKISDLTNERLNVSIYLLLIKRKIVSLINYQKTQKQERR